jgi:preprotein translocase subunit SecE
MAKTKSDKGAGATATVKEKNVAQAGSKAGDVGGAEPAAPARPRVGPFKFLQQVRQEVLKVTWPTWKETYVTTAMVFVMVILAALFFFLIDWLLGGAVSYGLKLVS